MIHKWHLYEIVIESPQMWLKIQASCWSEGQASAFLERRFGGNSPDPLRPDLPHSKPSFLVPCKLSECSERIFNWETIKGRLPHGWDDHEFQLAEGPYPWCETLSDDCDCCGSKGRVNVATYCSDFGLQDETDKRVSKSQNAWRFEYLQRLRQAAVNGQNTSRANRNSGTEARAEPSEEEGFYCHVDGRYHAYSEQVKQRTAAKVAAIRMSLATVREEDPRAVISNIGGITPDLLRRYQSQECAVRLAGGGADIPNVLYKYIPRKRIGKGAPNSLRATQILALNDNMECNVITMGAWETDILDFVALVQSRLKECLGAEVPEEELLERSTLHGDLRLSTYIQEYLNPRVGVVSFSTDLLVPTMWAHYAQNTGIVVGYDAKALRGIGFELRQVNYSELAPMYEPTRGDVIQLEFADRGQIERETRAGGTKEGIPILNSVDITRLGADWKALSRLLFVKGTSWAYEKEVRLLVDLQDARDTGETDRNSQPIKVIDIPTGAIKEIYGGERTSRADVAQAIEIARGEEKHGLLQGSVSSHAYRIQKTGGVQH